MSGIITKIRRGSSRNKAEENGSVIRKVSSSHRNTLSKSKSVPYNVSLSSLASTSPNDIKEDAPNELKKLSSTPPSSPSIVLSTSPTVTIDEDKGDNTAKKSNSFNFSDAQNKRRSDEPSLRAADYESFRRTQTLSEHNPRCDSLPALPTSIKKVKSSPNINSLTFNRNASSKNYQSRNPARRVLKQNSNEGVTNNSDSNSNNNYNNNDSNKDRDFSSNDFMFNKISNRSSYRKSICKSAHDTNNEILSEEQIERQKLQLELQLEEEEKERAIESRQTRLNPSHSLREDSEKSPVISYQSNVLPRSKSQENMHSIDNNKTDDLIPLRKKTKSIGGKMFTQLLAKGTSYQVDAEIRTRLDSSASASSHQSFRTSATEQSVEVTPPLHSLETSPFFNEKRFSRKSGRKRNDSSGTLNPLQNVFPLFQRKKIFSEVRKKAERFFWNAQSITKRR
eukprot:Awhi_evm1s12272